MGQWNSLDKCACLNSAYTKSGIIQRRLAWSLCKDDRQIQEVSHILKVISSLKKKKYIEEKEKGRMGTGMGGGGHTKQVPKQMPDLVHVPAYSHQGSIQYPLPQLG